MTALPAARPRAVLPALLLGAFITAGIALGLLAGDLFSVWFFLGYASAGSLLVWRQPRQVIGWLLLVIGWALCLASLSVHADPAVAARGGLTGVELIVAWGSFWGAFAVFGAILALAILFPTGELPGGHWKLPAVAVLVYATLLVAAAMVAPTINVSVGPGDTTVHLRNPVALLPDSPIWTAPPLGAAVNWAVAIELPASPLILLARFVRSAGVERLQMRWLVAAVLFLAITTLGGAVLSPLVGTVAWLPVAVAYPAIPAAIAVAVLRYRLYDIGALINRTVLYGTVTAALAVVVAVGNVAGQRLAEQLTGQHSDLVTAALAVAAALAFGPISRRLRPLADRLLPSRVTLTLLFIDIVGSTQKAVELGDEAWRDLLGRYRSVVRRELARNAGHEVDTAGDGFFATFDDTPAAVRCAIAARDGVQELGILARTGIHAGECDIRGETVTGVAVHAAARIMAAAADGEILVSDPVRRAAEQAGLGTQDRGVRELRGVPGRWRLYAVEVPNPSAR